MRKHGPKPFRFKVERLKGAKKPYGGCNNLPSLDRYIFMQIHNVYFNLTFRNGMSADYKL